MGIRHLSLADWRTDDPSTRAGFVRELGLGLEAHGFVAIEQCGIAPGLLDRAYQAASELFALPDAAKRACERPESGRQRGYTSLGVERAKDRSTGDLKEFWHVGTTSPGPGVPGNVFPDGPYEAVFTELYAALEGVASELLVAIGMVVGVDDGYFEDLIRGSNSVLRVIHYPPVVGPTGDAVRAAAHEDINLLTVLPASTASGLEIRLPDGAWMPVDAPAGSVIVDTGDMMSLLTSGRLPATTHRVVNPTDTAVAAQPRYSMPFFCHPRPDARLTPFDAVEGQGPTAGEFLHQRLVENGVS